MPQNIGMTMNPLVTGFLDSRDTGGPSPFRVGRYLRFDGPECQARTAAQMRGRPGAAYRLDQVILADRAARRGGEHRQDAQPHWTG